MKFLLKKEHMWLGAILLVSILLRIVQLFSYPHGFFTDEVVSGYVGRFLLVNGHDIHGNFLPLFYFDKFGDFRSIVPMYITGLFTFIFGINFLSIRLAPALFGAAIVLPMYGFTVAFTKSKKIALVASFFIAILPWHIVLSRAQSEGIMGLTIFLGAMALALPTDKKKSFKIIIAGVLFGLTYLFYPPFRILSPVVIFGYIFLSDKSGRKSYIFLFLALLLLTFMVLSTQWGKGRAEQTSLFSSKEIAEKINADNENSAIALGPNNVLLARVFHNKVVGYAREFGKQYFTFLSPQYLFFNGGLPYRYIIPEGGLIYITFIIFFISFVLIRGGNISTKSRIFLMYLLLVSILPSALTYEDSPNIHRSLVMMIPLVLLAAIGFYSLYAVSKKNLKPILIGSTMFLFLLEFIYLQHQYRYQAPSFRSYLRDDGLREAALWLVKNRNNYTKIYTTAYEDLAVFYLFESRNFDKSLMGTFERNPIYPKKMETIEFFRDFCPYEHNSAFNLKKGEVMVASGECVNYKDVKEIARIIRKDSTVAFKIYEGLK